jgi:Stage II sporulation protein E (SpoIIE)
VTSSAWGKRRTLGHAFAAEPVVVVGLLAGIAVSTWGILATSDVVPVSVLIVPILIGGIWLSPRGLIKVVVAAGIAMTVIAVRLPPKPATALAFAVTAIAAVLMLGFARSRHRLGVTGVSGESMLVDLRDRLVAQGVVPELPRGWHVDVVHRSAGSARFSGDFLVATRSGDGAMLELALVDVSGKGLAAGTRALLLSGAFGGLLGSLPPREFLPAANAYLLRQDWGEGFATAVHVAIDLMSGSYEVRTAGHPPAVQYHAGSGRWYTVPTTGGLLGVLDDEKFDAVLGALGVGDALLLYTDGLVEGPDRDFDVGIDKLMGEAERLVARGFDHGARTLVDLVPSSDADDRALVLLWRS